MGDGDYTEADFIGQQIVWGEGYMSPGGAAEVAALVAGLEIEGRDVLDVGCGLGGPSVDLVANHGAGRVTGIDTQAAQIACARALADRRGVADRVSFRRVDPGSLLFADATFDVVFSMGALMQIAGKPALIAEVFRVLRSGGAFTANDLLRPDDGPAPTGLVEFVETAGLIYHWASLATTRGALDGAGFIDVAIDDRGAWYREQLRGDIARLESGPTGARLRAAFGDDGRDAWIDLWSRLEALVAAGDLRPVQLRAIRPRLNPVRRTAVRRFPGTSG